MAKPVFSSPSPLKRSPPRASNRKPWSVRRKKKGEQKGERYPSDQPLAPPSSSSSSSSSSSGIFAGASSSSSSSASSSSRFVGGVDRGNLFGGLSARPVLSSGHKTYSIESLDDWNRIFRDWGSAPLRPAMSRVEVPYRRRGADKILFDLSAQERPKPHPEDIKINAMLFKKGGPQIIIYSKTKPEKESKGKPKEKMILDDVPQGDQPSYAKDILRVMRGRAKEKGLQSPYAEKAVVAGTLIMTSERLRHWLNPVNAHMELYRVKYDKASLTDVFHYSTGTFVAAQGQGADRSRKTVDEGYLRNLVNLEDMRDIWDNHARQKEKHRERNFGQWVEYKTNRWAYPWE